MDKDYLIHNIKVSDDPENGHETVDLELRNIAVDGDDVTADITIIKRVNGVVESVNVNENVSMNGGGGLNFDVIIKYDVNTWDPTLILGDYNSVKSKLADKIPVYAYAVGVGTAVGNHPWSYGQIAKLYDMGTFITIDCDNLSDISSAIFIAKWNPDNSIVDDSA